MPLLSIIIPTHRRPALLVRAINSVINIYNGFDIEIIVIPNGPDDTWQAIADRYSDDTRIKWLYLSSGNASAARNHGLIHAKGTFIRFLDDDDYLLPGAIEQLQQISRYMSDACSAPLQHTTPDGTGKDIAQLPATNDFVSAAISAIGISLNQGTILKRSFVQNCRWREDVNLYDDYFWMLEVALSSEAAWIQITVPVCAYVQHNGNRLSRVQRTSRNSRNWVNTLLKFYEQLSKKQRLTPERKTAIATALLTHAHSAFPASPLFLGQVILQAREIAPAASPMQPLFARHQRFTKHMVTLEWVILLPRYLTRSYRRAVWSIGRWVERWKAYVSAHNGTNDR